MTPQSSTNTLVPLYSVVADLLNGGGGARVAGTIHEDRQREQRLYRRKICTATVRGRVLESRGTRRGAGPFPRLRGHEDVTGLPPSERHHLASGSVRGLTGEYHENHLALDSVRGQRHSSRSHVLRTSGTVLTTDSDIRRRQNQVSRTSSRIRVHWGPLEGPHDLASREMVVRRSYFERTRGYPTTLSSACLDRLGVSS